MSSKHSIKVYADDATLISTSKEVHTEVLTEIDLKAGDVGLNLIVFPYSSMVQNFGITCINWWYYGATKFLGKLIGISAHTTKVASGKAMFDKFSDLLQKVDSLPIRPEYQVWIYRNYVLSNIRFHVSVDSMELPLSLKWKIWLPNT